MINFTQTDIFNPLFLAIMMIFCLVPMKTQYLKYNYPCCQLINSVIFSDFLFGKNVEKIQLIRHNLSKGGQSLDGFRQSIAEINIYTNYTETYVSLSNIFLESLSAKKWICKCVIYLQCRLRVGWVSSALIFMLITSH